MERIELELDRQTIERARQLAQARHCTVEQLLREMYRKPRIDRD